VPTFEITSPDGRKFRVTGPEGSTKEQALEQVQRQVSQQQPSAQSNQAAPQPGQPSTPQGLQPRDFPSPFPGLSMGRATDIIRNVPASAGRAVTDFAHAVAHPIETAKSLYEAGPSGIAQVYVDKYGGIENLKKSVTEDPIGTLMDMSTFLSGGGAAAARLPGMAGRIGEAASVAGRATDPLLGAAKVARQGAKLGTEIIGGIGTHAGGEPLAIAYRAGRSGGDKSADVLGHMRAQAPAQEVVEEARKAIGQMKTERGQAYNDHMSKLGLTNKIKSWDKIDDALVRISQMKTFHGVPMSPAMQKVTEQVGQEVATWRNLDPGTFHTIEGLDAFKKRIWETVVEPTKYGTAERKAAMDAYSAIRQSIIDTEPRYAPIMKAYEKASDIINQMEKTLSLNPNASIDTSLRKLQAVLRNNVNTSYGYRRELADFLVRAGAPNLMEKLAGQALQPILPRGLGRLGAMLGFEMGPGFWKAAAAAPFMSPRAMGELYHGAGQAAAQLNKLPMHGIGQATYQSGRMYDIMKKRLEEDRRRNLYQSTE